MESATAEQNVLFDTVNKTDRRFGHSAFLFLLISLVVLLLFRSRESRHHSEVGSPSYEPPIRIIKQAAGKTIPTQGLLAGMLWLFYDRNCASEVVLESPLLTAGLSQGRKRAHLGGGFGELQ